MNEMTKNIAIEVAYATSKRQKIIALTVAPNTSLIDAVKQSGITEIFPDLDIENADLGVWGKVKPAKAIVESGQRIEIYRELIADPKESRRKRAEKKPLKKTCQITQ